MFSSNLHNQDFGTYVTGGVVKVSATQSHDQSRGFCIGSGTLTVTASDIFANSYGLRFGGGTLTFTENAIYGNTSEGVHNDTANNITVDDNWWGWWVSPGACEGGMCSDSTSTQVTVNTWYQGTGHYSVRNAHSNFISSTKYTNELNTATSAWGSVSNGVGIIPITHVSITAEASLIVSDTDAVVPWEGDTIITDVPGVTDTLRFSTLLMDPDTAANKQQCAMHELGHALGLGHSNPALEDVMHSPLNNQNALGPEDKSYYTFLWGTMMWAAPMRWLW